MGIPRPQNTFVGMWIISNESNDRRRETLRQYLETHKKALTEEAGKSRRHSKDEHKYASGIKDKGGYVG